MVLCTVLLGGQDAHLYVYYISLIIVYEDRFGACLWSQASRQPDMPALIISLVKIITVRCY